ncbi:MAG: endo alpha-1,4 polygalactosaminidase [Acidobacteria bacterium]|nr:endo alpha-1,4 polygalactosaminidase [Acidobacteriota bacterium]
MRVSMLCFSLFILPAVQGSDPVWRPLPETSWQWQLSGKVDLSADVEMFDIDLFDTSKEEVAAIHAKGARAVCYMSAGTFEPWRPDAAAFPDWVKGRGVSGWPDEKWLDIRRLDVLGPIMEARLDLCRAKGFDGVEPDNVDGYSNRSGFSLKGDDQLKYNRFLAAAAHARGLSVGLKNDVDQVKYLVNDFDWALNEQCFEYRECTALTLFTGAGKAVFHVEYELPSAEFCQQANVMNFNSMRMQYELDGFREPCRERKPPEAAKVVNAASLQPGGVAPNEIVAILGSGFGQYPLVRSGPAESTTTLAGVSVYFDGIAAELISINASQVSAVVPREAAGRERTVLQVLRTAAKSVPAELPVVPLHPGLFTADSSGKGQLVGIYEDGTLNSKSNPAQRGAIVGLWGTGFGEGAVAVKIGGQDAEVVSPLAGVPGMPGLQQMYIRIPASAPGGDEVAVELSGAAGEAQAGITLAIAP